MSEQELTKKVECLEAKLQEMADIQAIEQLRESYSHYANVQGQSDAERLEGAKKWAANFAEDGVFVSQFGNYTGFDALCDCIYTQGAPFEVFMHYVTNGHITLNGDTATGYWSGIFPYVMKGGNEWGILYAYYDDEYVRTPDGWKFKKVDGVTLVSVDPSLPTSNVMRRPE